MFWDFLRQHSPGVDILMTQQTSPLLGSVTTTHDDMCTHVNSAELMMTDPDSPIRSRTRDAETDRCVSVCDCQEKHFFFLKAF